MDETGEHRGFWQLLGLDHARSRVLLILLLLLIVGLAMVYVWLHPYLRQRAAVKAIQSAGGTVVLEEIDYNKNNFLVTACRRLMAYGFGDNFVSRAASVAINKDEAMNAVGGLNAPALLWLNGPGVSDAALDRLGSCPQIESIIISDTHITAAGLDKLKLLPKLKEVKLIGRRVSDQWLAQLGSSGVLPKLHNLICFRTSITDDGVKWIGTSSNLEMLDLSTTAVTDAGLRQLKDLTALKHIKLDQTRISDAGLEALAEIKSLRSIQALFARITKDGLQKFGRERPDCSLVTHFGVRGAVIPPGERH